VKCPFCSHEDDKVLESRAVKGGEAIKRRRECLKCSRRFTTYEEIEQWQVMVIKKDQRRQAFDREKVLRGMRVACEKRPVSVEKLESIVDDIERSIYDKGVKEIESTKIGNMVSSALRKVDKIAYVRFASVYRQFEDVGQFKQIVDVLDSKRARKTGKKAGS